MMEAILPSEMSVVTRATGDTSQKTAVFIVTAVTLNNTLCNGSKVSDSRDATPPVWALTSYISCLEGVYVISRITHITRASRGIIVVMDKGPVVTIDSELGASRHGVSGLSQATSNRDITYCELAYSVVIFVLNYLDYNSYAFFKSQFLIAKS
jgi:hypothetical protein